MSAGSEDDLICDFAEYYHVLYWRELPLKLAATLAIGLPADSRSKRRISGIDVPIETLLLAKITDLLATWVWWNSEDGSKGRNRPQSVVAALTASNKPEPKHRVFRTGNDFRSEYDRIAGAK